MAARAGRAALIGLLALVLGAASTGAQPMEERYPGPYHAEVLRVIDGDTIEVRVAIWPGLLADWSVRLRGVDAPETFRPACLREDLMGRAARAFVARRYAPGDTIRLLDVERGDFAGRVIADIRRWRSDRWLSLAQEMVEARVAWPWRPGLPPIPWCRLGRGR